MTTKEVKYKKLIKKNIYFVVKLDELYLNRKYTGFYYVIVILDKLINNNIQVKSFSKQIYPIAAKKFNKNVCTIERNIRILIKNCWNEKIVQKLNLPLDSQKPSVCEFINMLHNYIKLQLAI